jgi:hypothetical protein
MSGQMERGNHGPRTKAKYSVTVSHFYTASSQRYVYLALHANCRALILNALYFVPPLIVCIWHRPAVYATKPNATSGNANAPHTPAVALTFGGTGMPAPKAEVAVDDTLTTATQHFTLARPQQKAHELVRRECCFRKHSFC